MKANNKKQILLLELFPNQSEGKLQITLMKLLIQRTKSPKFYLSPIFQ